MKRFAGGDAGNSAARIGVLAIQCEPMLSA